MSPPVDDWFCVVPSLVEFLRLILMDTVGLKNPLMSWLDSFARCVNALPAFMTAGWMLVTQENSSLGVCFNLSASDMVNILRSR